MNPVLVTVVRTNTGKYRFYNWLTRTVYGQERTDLGEAQQIARRESEGLVAGSRRMLPSGYTHV